MGLYDTYASVQLKVGPRVCKDYVVGDSVPIADGVYVGWDGAVVVIGGQLAAVFSEVTDKWGNSISFGTMLGLEGWIDGNVDSESPAA